MVFIRFLFKILDQVGSPFSLLLNFLSFNNLFYISYLCFLFYSGIFRHFYQSFWDFTVSFFFVFVSFKSFPLSYSTLFTFLFFFLVLFFSYSTRKSWRMKKRQDTGNSWESKWCRVQYRSLTAGPLRTAMSDSTRYWAVGATYTQAYFARLTIS